jgi:hypothetical protein
LDQQTRLNNIRGCSRPCIVCVDLFFWVWAQCNQRHYEKKKIDCDIKKQNLRKMTCFRSQGHLHTVVTTGWLACVLVLLWSSTKLHAQQLDFSQICMHGIPGERGFNGSQGIQGIQGERGYNGSRGIQGPRGPMGPPGFNGSEGIQGPQGDQGIQGIQGPPGANGILSAVVGTIRVEKAPRGNDTSCSSSGSPCLTIARALQLAQEGEVVLVSPGTYNESFTIPQNVRVLGLDRRQVIIQSILTLPVVSPYKQIVMGEGSGLDTVTIKVIAYYPGTYIGIHFPNETTASAIVERTRIVVDVSAAGDQVSHVRGIYSDGFVDADEESIAVRECDVDVKTAGNGTARAILLDTMASHLHVLDSTLQALVVLPGGSGSAIAVESAIADGVIVLDSCDMIAHAIGFGNEDDAPFASINPSDIVIEPLLLCPPNTVCVQQEPHGNDATCQRGFIPCVTVTQALIESQAGDTILIYPGVYDEIIVMPTQRSLQGIHAERTILRAAGVTSNTVLLTMADSSYVNFMTLLMTSVVHPVTMTAILFPAASAESAAFVNGHIIINNAFAPSSGASDVRGVLALGYGAPLPAEVSIALTTISITTTGLGRADGIVIGVSPGHGSNSMRVRGSLLDILRVAGLGETSAVRINSTGARLFLDDVSLDAESLDETEPGQTVVDIDDGGVALGVVLGPEPKCPDNVVCVQSSSVSAAANDFKCRRGYVPCASISRALELVQSGDQVLVWPGIYSETNDLTIPANVTVKGTHRQSVVIQHLFATGNVDFVTMGVSSSLESVTLDLHSAQHHTLRAVVFPSGTCTTATLRDVDITVDNSGASGAGSSTVVGVWSSGSGTAAASFDALADLSVTVRSNGNGNAYGVLLDTAANTMRARDLNIMVTMGTGGSGTPWGARVNVASGSLELKTTSFSVRSDGSGTPTDFAATLGTITVGTPFNCPANTICVQTAPIGSDSKCQKGYWPCLTIAKALSLATTSGNQVLVFTGTYSESGLTIPTGVGLIGVERDQTVLSVTGATSDTTMITMGTNSRFENILVSVASSQHHTFKGVVFSGSTNTNAMVRNVGITINNAGAGAGTSTIYGIHCTASGGTPDYSFEAVRDVVITIKSAGSGVAKGIYANTGSHRLNVAYTTIMTTASLPGAATSIAVHSDFSGSTVDLRYCILSATTNSGTSVADFSATNSGTVLSGPVPNSPARVVYVQASPWADDIRCQVGYWPCATIAQALTLAGDLGTTAEVQVFPGTYAESGLNIPASVTLRGISRKSTILSATGLTSDTTMVTMSASSVLKDMQLIMTSSQHHTFKGVLFDIDDATTASVTNVFINIDNSGAGAGTSTIYGIHADGTSTGTPTYDMENAREVSIAISTIGSGTSRAIYVEAGTFRASVVHALVTKASPGAGTAIAFEGVGLGTVLNLRFVAASVSSSGGTSTAVTATSSAAVTVDPPPMCGSNEICVMKAPFGDNSKCGRQLWPCATIAKALTLASSGDVVRVFAGAYSESSLTLPTGVGLIGTERDQVSIAISAAAADTTLVNMGINSRLENMLLSIASVDHHTFKGVVFSGTTNTNAVVRNVGITIDNSGAGAGTSTIYGIHCTASGGTPDYSFEAVRDVVIKIKSVGSGVAKGIYGNTGTHRLNVAYSTIMTNVTSPGSASSIAVHSDFSGSTIDLRYCILLGTTAGSGSAADFSATNSGTVLSGPVPNSPTKVVYVMASPWADDTRCQAGYWSCATISRALTVAGAVGGVAEVQVFPGTYAESGLTIPASVTLRGINRKITTLIATSVTTNVTMITMSANSLFENFQLSLTSSEHHLLKGILFSGSTATTAAVRNVYINMDNSGAGAGTSFVYGVHVDSTGTGAPTFEFDNLRDMAISVATVGSGTGHAVFVQGGTFRGSNIQALVTKASPGTGTASAFKATGATAVLALRFATASVSAAGGGVSRAFETTQSGTLTVDPPPMSGTNQIDVMKSPFGDDTKCGRQFWPCATIAKAITLASSGDTIMVHAGTYSETGLTIPSGVTLKGINRRATILSGTTLTADTTMITMSTNSVLQDFGIVMTSAEHHTFKAILFSSSVATTAIVRNVYISFDNTGAGAGTSTVYAIHGDGTSTGAPTFEFDNVRDTAITIASTGSGTVRGIRIEGGTFRVSITQVLVTTVTPGTATVYAWESVGASTVLALRFVTENVSAFSTTQSAILLTSSGTVTIEPPPLCGTNQVCVMQAPLGDDTRCGRSYRPCATITKALSLASSGDIVLVYAGTYAESGLIIPTGVGLKGILKTHVILTSTGASSTTFITMGTSSSVESLTLSISSTSHNTFKGIVFPGTTTADSKIRDIDITIVNSGAATLGTSAITGIHSSGTGIATEAFINVLDVTVKINSIGSGTKRGLLSDTANTIRCQGLHVSLVNTTNAGSYIGVESNHASATIFLSRGSIAGATADISQTLGSLTLAGTRLVNENANGKTFSSTDAPIWTFSSLPAVNVGTGTLYWGISATPNAQEVTFRLPRASVVKNMFVTCANPGASAQYVFTVRKNKATTPLTVTLPSATSTVSANTVSVRFSAVDLISLQTVYSGGGNSQGIVVTLEYY